MVIVRKIKPLSVILKGGNGQAPLLDSLELMELKLHNIMFVFIVLNFQRN